MSTAKAAVLTAIATAFTCTALASFSAQGQVPENQTVVDTTLDPAPTTLEWGLLHGFTDCFASGGVDCVDPTPLIDALAPETWRISNFPAGTHRYVIGEADFPGRHGTQIYWGVQESFNMWLNDGVYGGHRFCVGAPDCIPNPNNIFPTFEALKEAWRTFLIEAAPDRPPIDWYDVFAEPAIAFKNVTPAQLGEILVMTHDMIRSVEPDAKIVGPSIFTYHQPTMRAVLDFARITGIRLDAISWHEFGTPDQVIAHAEDLRSMCAPNCPEFHINEYQDSVSSLIPGGQVLWLAALERAGVSQAHRACWDMPVGDPQGPTLSTCWATFDGLLGPDNQALQPGYWVHKAYQELDELRIEVDMQNARAATIAAISTAQDRVSLLVGAGQSSGTSSETIFVDVPQWDASTTVEVRMTRIENLGNVLHESSYEPVTTTHHVAASLGRVEIPAFELSSGDAWSIVLVPDLAAPQASEPAPAPQTVSETDSEPVQQAAPTPPPAKLWRPRRR